MFSSISVKSAAASRVGESPQYSVAAFNTPTKSSEPAALPLTAPESDVPDNIINSCAVPSDIVLTKYLKLPCLSYTLPSYPCPLAGSTPI